MNIIHSLKKAFSIVAMATFVAQSLVAVPAQAATFQDVNENDWFYTYVEELANQGFISQKAFFRPNDTMNRAEMIKLVIESIGGIDPEAGEVQTFNDVTPADWFYPYVETGVLGGIVHGYERGKYFDKTGSFAPSDPVTRAAAIKTITNAYHIPTPPNCGLEQINFFDVPTEEWYYYPVAAGYWNGIVSGFTNTDGSPTGRFGPGELVTRAEIAKMIVAAQNATPKVCDGVPAFEQNNDEETADIETNDETQTEEETSDEATESDEEETSENTIEATSLSIALNEAKTPSQSQEIAGNGTTVNMIPLTITPDQGAGTISTLTVNYIGKGKIGDVKQVWAENVQGKILATASAFDANKTATITFEPALEVTAENNNISIWARIESIANSKDLFYQMQVTSAQSVTSKQTAEGTFPIAGPKFTINDIQNPEVVFRTETGEGTVSVGAQNSNLGRFFLKNDQKTIGQDISVSKVFVTYNGNVSADLITNASLYVGDKKVSNTVSEVTENGAVFTLTNQKATSNFTGYTIGTGKEVEFVIKGTVMGSDQANGIVQFGLKDLRYVHAHELGSKARLKVRLNQASAQTPVQMKPYTIRAAGITLTPSAQTPKAAEIITGSKDQKILVTQVHSQGVDVEEMKLRLHISLPELIASRQSEIQMSEMIENIRIRQFQGDSATAERKIVAQGGAPRTSLITLSDGESEFVVEIPVDKRFTVPNTFVTDAQPTYWEIVIDSKISPATRLPFSGIEITAEINANDITKVRATGVQTIISADDINGDVTGETFTFQRAATATEATAEENN